jgi:P-type Mg2+ transporter
LPGEQFVPPLLELHGLDHAARIADIRAGLTSAEALRRLAHYGLNRIKPRRPSDSLALLLAQFKSPIILILLFAAGLSVFLRDPTDALIILSIVLVSGLLGFWQEKGATDAVAKLLAIVQTRAAVLRDGKEIEISVEELVPGDIVIFNAGDLGTRRFRHLRAAQHAGARAHTRY